MEPFGYENGDDEVEDLGLDAGKELGRREVCSPAVARKATDTDE